MEEFLQLKWGIQGPHELDIGTDFIPEEEIALSYIFTGLNTENEDAEVEYKQPATEVKRRSVSGEYFNFKSNIKSFLNTNQQAKCLTALTLKQSDKKPTGFYEQGCVELYNNSHQQILQENAKFLEFAKQHFMKNKNRLFKFRPLLKSYSESLWKYKLERCKHYKQFYKGFDMLPYSYRNDEEPVEMVHLQNLLELGTVARFAGPTLLKPYHLKKGLLPRAKVLYPSNQEVSKDINIDKLIETTEVDVVISSSGLTRLLNFTKNKTLWDIPVVMKEIHLQNTDGATKTKKVIFIDKPFPIKSPDVFELNKNCTKILFKSIFCDTEALRFQNTESPLDIYHIPFSTQEQSKNKTTTKEGCNKRNESAHSCDETNSDNVKRKLESTDEHGEDCKKIRCDNEDPQINIDELKNKIHHNVSYRLWKLQLKSEQCELMKSKCQRNSINVLVRCKLDGCEFAENGQLQPINVIPKMEYHLEYGGGIPTVDELVKQWVYAFFRPCSQVHRIRTHYINGEVIAVENCTIQKTISEAQTYHQYSPHLGLGVLYKIFSALSQLIPGEYILHHLPKDGSFVSLLREVDKSEDATYNLYEEYDFNKFNIHRNRTNQWHSIDVNYILPRHRSFQQMPGMFKPCLVKKYNNKNKIMWKKKKNKKKNTATENVID